MATLDPRSSDRGFFEAVAQKTSTPSFVDLSLRETLPAIPVPWAVDDGHDIVTRSTGELWTGLARAWISPLARVWREGMEAWAPILEVPELSCALVGFDPAKAEALALGAASRSADDLQARDMTPAPVATPVSEPPAPARPDRLGLYGVAAAVLVSVAILLSPLRGAERFEPARGGTAAPLARRGAAVAVEARAPRPLEPYFPLREASPGAATDASTPADSARPAAEPARKPERGQQRRRTR